MKPKTTVLILSTIVLILSTPAHTQEPTDAQLLAAAKELQEFCEKAGGCVIIPISHADAMVRQLKELEDALEKKCTANTTAFTVWTASGVKALYSKHFVYNLGA